MTIHETVRKMTDGQRRGDIVATMAGAIPPDLTFEEAQAIIGKKGPLVDEVRAAFAKRRFASSQATTFTVEVEYTKTVEEMMEAGRYDWKNSDVNSKNFRTERTGKAELTIELLHFNRDMSTDVVLKELDRMGYRAAELHELLAFGEKYPDVQREFPIVALSSVWRGPGGYRGVPCLGGYGSERYLRLDWLVRGWYNLFRFAAVRK